MQRFLIGNDLKKEVEQVLGEKGCKCAVAFWGKGAAEKLFEQGKYARIVCNLKSGGTNPYEIEKIDRSRVRQSDILHAKVYIGAQRAIVTSANASANGLGLEGDEQGTWIEAGILVEEMQEIRAWFEDLWKTARKIEDDDIEEAKRVWKNRESVKAQLASFAHFDPERENLPLPYWVVESDWDYDEVAVEDLGGGEDAKQIIDDSMEVETGDAEAMKRGTWLVIWGRRNAHLGAPDRRSRAYWFRCGDFKKKAFKYKSDKPNTPSRDIAMDATEGFEPPFDLNEVFVRETFWEVISEERFKELRRETNGEGFFSKKGRMGLIRDFWRECKKHYEQKTMDLATD